MADLGDIAAQVRQRAEKLTGQEDQRELDIQFVTECMQADQRGDGVLFASKFRDQYLKNVTQKKADEWYRWDGNVWELDDYSDVVNAVEEVALEYQAQADRLKAEIEADGVEKGHKDEWKLTRKKDFGAAVKRLRKKDGGKNALYFAPIVLKDLACKVEAFDQHPWLLPCANGVIDLEKCVLTRGRPSDLMRTAINIPYDPHADYRPFEQFLREISNSDEEMPGFIRRSLGYALTGLSTEQFIWVFLGPGRNGKGVLFNLMSRLLGPFYHSINPVMLLEQKIPPSASAASEHLYSLIGKRLIVGSEPDEGAKIGSSGVKRLTGNDIINCRPNFMSEINFRLNSALVLLCNDVPRGLTKDFALKERLMLLNFPFRFVTDPEAKRRDDPGNAHRYRQRNPHLEEELTRFLPGILRYLVEGCLEWQREGLKPPPQVLKAVDDLSHEEDYIGRFAEGCLVKIPGEPDENCRMVGSYVYSAFKWWWKENEGGNAKIVPTMKTFYKGLREHGWPVDAKGGKTWLYCASINLDIAHEVTAFAMSHG